MPVRTTWSEAVAGLAGVRGTWDRNKRHWSNPVSRFGKMVWRRFAVRVMTRPDFWNHALEGALATTGWEIIRRADLEPRWHEGAKHLVKWLLKNAGKDSTEKDPPLAVCTHSHGGNVAALAFATLLNDPDWHAGRRRVCWIAGDLPVRHGWTGIYDQALRALEVRNQAHTLPCVQTRSKWWDPRSCWRWLGSDRLPTDRPKIGTGRQRLDVATVDQPGGHSRVFHKPEKYLAWWTGVFSKLALDTRYELQEGGIVKALPHCVPSMVTTEAATANADGTITISLPGAEVDPDA